MLDLELYFKTRGLEETDENMLKYTVSAYRLSSSGYASAWALTHYLANENETAFAAYLREVSRMEPFESPGELEEPGLVPQNLQRFQTHFGADLPALEKRIIEHLKTLPYDDPFAQLPHFAAMLEWTVRGVRQRDANVFHVREMATKWLEDKRKVLTEAGVPRATVSIGEYPNRLMAESDARRFLGS
jgi:hypothetical protein